MSELTRLERAVARVQGGMDGAKDPRIDFCRIAMMQKNERSLLRAWIRHYTSIFVPHAITILDNGSTDFETIQILNEAAELGITVDATHKSSGDFQRKGDLVSGVLRQFQGQYEFFYPCDCDEFLLPDAEPPPPDQVIDAYRAAFEAMRAQPTTIFRLSKEFRNIPGTTSVFIDRGWKSMFRHRVPPKVDIGFHLWDFAGKTDAYPDILPGGFCIAHFHYKPFDLLLEAAREKLKTRIKDFHPETIWAYRGDGMHLRDHLVTKAPQYYEKLNKKTKVSIDGWFADRGLEMPYSDPSNVLADDHPAVVHARRPHNTAFYYKLVLMTEREIALLERHLMKAQIYLEYGLGGSTRLATDLGVPRIGSVESSAEFIRSCISVHKFQKPIESGRLEIFHRDIGPTKLWGFPENDVSRETVEQFIAVPPAFAEADTALVDGRFRLSCVCALYMGLKRPDALVMVHDFHGRPQYQRALELFEKVEDVDQLIVLRRKPGLEALCAEILNESWKDPW